MGSNIVFDAEPVVATALDEQGADVVESYYAEIRSGDIKGWMCTANLLEVHYIVGRGATKEKADTVTDFLIDLGINFIDVGNIYLGASRFKREYSVALGDAMALATTEEVDDAALLVGADDCYDDIEESAGEPEIIRFRDESD